MLRKLQAKTADVLYKIANAVMALARYCLWPRSRPAQAKSVCLYRIANLGDTICALPAMHAVRMAYPDAKLTLVTSPGKRGMPGARELLAGASWLDDLVVYYSDEIASLRQRLALVKRLRERRFDVWMELPNDLATLPVLLRNMLLARLSGARWGYGWRLSTVRWGARAQSESKVFPNEVDRLLGVVESSGVRAQPARFPLPLNGEHASGVDSLLHDSVPGAPLLVAIAPGAKRSTNRWPVERFTEVAQALSRQGFFVLLLGGDGDKQACERIAGETAGRALNLAGQLSVLESCEVLRRCAFLVCNDSGAQHMAAAVSTPCIAVFSVRDMPGKWRPYGQQHVVLQKDVPCHTCYLEECPHDNLCVRLVRVSDVLRATELLGFRSQRPGARMNPQITQISQIQKPGR